MPSFLTPLLSLSLSLLVATDNIAPVISDCPSDIFENVATGVSSVQVSWTEPTALDGEGQVTVVSTASPGAVFSLGITP